MAGVHATGAAAKRVRRPAHCLARRNRRRAHASEPRTGRIGERRRERRVRACVCQPCAERVGERGRGRRARAGDSNCLHIIGLCV